MTMSAQTTSGTLTTVKSSHMYVLKPSNNRNNNNQDSQKTVSVNFGNINKYTLSRTVEDSNPLNNSTLKQSEYDSTLKRSEVSRDSAQRLMSAVIARNALRYSHNGYDNPALNNDMHTHTNDYDNLIYLNPSEYQSDFSSAEKEKLSEVDGHCHAAAHGDEKAEVGLSASNTTHNNTLQKFCTSTLQQPSITLSSPTIYNKNYNRIEINSTKDFSISQDQSACNKSGLPHHILTPAVRNSLQRSRVVPSDDKFDLNATASESSVQCANENFYNKPPQGPQAPQRKFYRKSEERMIKAQSETSDIPLDSRGSFFSSLIRRSRSPSPSRSSKRSQSPSFLRGSEIARRLSEPFRTFNQSAPERRVRPRKTSDSDANYGFDTSSKINGDLTVDSDHIPRSDQLYNKMWLDYSSTSNQIRGPTSGQLKYEINNDHAEIKGKENGYRDQRSDDITISPKVNEIKKFFTSSSEQTINGYPLSHSKASNQNNNLKSTNNFDNYIGEKLFTSQTAITNIKLPLVNLNSPSNAVKPTMAVTSSVMASQPYYCAFDDRSPSHENIVKANIKPDSNNILNSSVKIKTEGGSKPRLQADKQWEEIFKETPNDKIIVSTNLTITRDSNPVSKSENYVGNRNNYAERNELNHSRTLTFLPRDSAERDIPKSSSSNQKHIVNYSFDSSNWNDLPALDRCQNLDKKVNKSVKFKDEEPQRFSSHFEINDDIPRRLSSQLNCVSMPRPTLHPTSQTTNNYSDDYAVLVESNEKLNGNHRNVPNFNNNVQCNSRLSNPAHAQYHQEKISSKIKPEQNEVENKTGGLLIRRLSISKRLNRLKNQLYDMTRIQKDLSKQINGEGKVCLPLNFRHGDESAVKFETKQNELEERIKELFHEREKLEAERLEAHDEIEIIDEMLKGLIFKQHNRTDEQLHNNDETLPLHSIERDGSLERARNMEIIASSSKTSSLPRRNSMSKLLHSLNLSPIESKTKGLERSNSFVNKASNNCAFAHQQSRPLTRYMPVLDASIDLRLFIESCGHKLEQCPYVTVTSCQCCGFLNKLSKNSNPIKKWKKRWFLFDRSSRCLYYSVDASADMRSHRTVFFQSIQDVFVDHLQISRSPTPGLTFCVKTVDRVYFLMAQSAESMRIWVDVIFTGAEAYQQFL